MASKVSRGPGGVGQHTAGIYADMTVDGPEIGTLVMIIDRAKNLPNRRTMGKQDPYCAARLGKEAKKTDTDKRGGQTPRWDQELRFTVHDSPDYNHLKVSVFNDDKKTDLIGETMISLEEVLLPGGGQGDQWHLLNCKGRYAGEIRIELTYYDSRPKTERTKDKGKKYSVTDLATLDHQASIANSKVSAVVKRRPLPSDPTGPKVGYTQSTNAAPTSLSGPRSYHTPALQDSPTRSPYVQYHDMNDNNRHASQNSSFSATTRSHSGFSQPLSSPIGSSMAEIEYPDMQNDYDLSNEMHHESELLDDEQQDQDGFDNYDMPVSDDPYALNTVHSLNYVKDYDAGTQSMPARNNRVHELSGSPAPRPSPDLFLFHTQSAPSLGSNEHYQEMNHDYRDVSREWNDDNAFLNSPDQNNESPSSPHAHSYAMIYTDSNSIHNRNEQSIAPPPPAHRNSAPAVPRLANHSNAIQHTGSSSRPLRMSANAHELHDNATFLVKNREDGQHSWQRDEPSLKVYQPQGISPCAVPQLHHHYQSADGLHSRYRDHQLQAHYNYRDDNQQACLAETTELHSRRSLGMSSTSPNYKQPQNHSARSVMTSQPRIEAQRMIEDNAVRQIHTIPLIKPKALGPHRVSASSSILPHPTTPRFPTLQPPQGRAQSTAPYSPDSFAVFNPRQANPGAPKGSNSNDGIVPRTQRELSPMYNNPTNTTTPPQQEPPGLACSADSPIVGLNGKVKDPTDHLPPSSYAPEPERKGSRPSLVVNQRNRFGPREARSVPVNTRQQQLTSAIPNPGGMSSNINLRQSLQQFQQPPGTKDPLGPTQDGPLNSQHGNYEGNTQNGNPNFAGYGFGYDRAEVFAPPVPAKIPLDGRESHGHMAGANGAFISDMMGLSLDGTSDDMGVLYGGRGGTARPRRSRFGA